MDSPRAMRRAADQRVKDRARRVMLIWAGNRQRPSNLQIVTPQAVGVNASTHCRPCSCFLCQPGREVPPPRERAFTILTWHDLG